MGPGPRAESAYAVSRLSAFRLLCCLIFIFVFTASRGRDPVACWEGARGSPPPHSTHPSPATTGDPLNIVLVFSDDAGYNESGLSGNPSFPTPRLNELAQQGVRFTDAYVSAPECSPSRAGMLTGRYQHRFGYESNIFDRGRADSPEGMPTDQVLISEVLADLGYTTGIVGKWHLGVRKGENRPLDFGFDEFFGFLASHRFYYGWTWWNFGQAIMRGDDLYPAWLQEGDPASYDTILTKNRSIPDSRYLTDALGDEAAAFIEDHHDDENPFFLYLSFTAVHQPENVKQSDFDFIRDVAHPFQWEVSAMTYAMDRALGQVLDRLDDPNGDGDESDSIAGSTLVIYLNDNGGVKFPYPRDNGPFRGWKYSMYEGGIRVPFVIRDPRLRARGRGVVYRQPITSLDLFPTIVAAAGGRMVTPTDGVNLYPQLSGDDPTPPHEVMHWRRFEDWAIRKGAWKLVDSIASKAPELYFLPFTPGEDIDLVDSYPTVKTDLLDELTVWEAELAKPAWGKSDLIGNASVDSFVYAEAHGTHSWSESKIWREQGDIGSEMLTMNPADAYANASLEFRVNEANDFTATNDLLRMTANTFMLNALHLAGHFDSNLELTGTIDGNELLMVRNQLGDFPELLLSATGSGSTPYTFHLDNDIELMDDLQIRGDGSEEFVLAGSIRSFATGRNLARETGIIKSGKSRVLLTGANPYTGRTRILGGELRVDGAEASISQTAGISLLFGGTLSLLSGEIITPTLVRFWWGRFDFLGGTFAAGEVWGGLENKGGTFAPGLAAASSKIWGDYIQDAGVLQLEIRASSIGQDFDRLEVRGTIEAGGSLRITLNGYAPTLGDRFELLTAGRTRGDFSLDSPKGSDGRDIFRLRRGRHSWIAEVVSI